MLRSVAHKEKISETEQALHEIPGLLLRERSKQARNPKQIWFVGTGSSWHVALWSSWIAGGEVRTAWDLLVSGAKPPRSALTIVISHRGAKGLTARVLKHLKGRKVLLVCADGAPTGKSKAIHSSRKERSTAHTISVIGAMTAIVSYLSDSKTDRRILAGILHRHREGVLSGGIRMPSLKRRLSFVGGASFHAVALELALKSREMAHDPAVGFGLEEILHGPIVSLGRHDHVVFLPKLGGKVTELENGRMAEAMKRVRRTKAEISVPRFTPADEKLLSKLPPHWQAVAYLYWGQWMLLGRALKRRVNPDKNPFL